jgi:hypothetical protein
VWRIRGNEPATSGRSTTISINKSILIAISRSSNMNISMIFIPHTLSLHHLSSCTKIALVIVIFIFVVVISIVAVAIAILITIATTIVVGIVNITVSITLISTILY